MECISELVCGDNLVLSQPFEDWYTRTKVLNLTPAATGTLWSDLGE